jgi:glutamine amidotransferase
MATTVINYGNSNIFSVLNALDEMGEDVVIGADPATVSRAERIILPGVGAFGPAMARLSETGLAAAIDDAVRRRGVPYLGICLGMQLMAQRGFEGGSATDGFGWVEGDVVALEPEPPSWRVPHMGWAVVGWNDDAPLASNLPKDAAFYFCHSYHVASPVESVRGVVDFHGSAVAALGAGSALGVQFHPERSGNNGLRLLENFLNWNPV